MNKLHLFSQKMELQKKNERNTVAVRTNGGSGSYELEAFQPRWNRMIWSCGLFIVRLELT